VNRQIKTAPPGQEQLLRPAAAVLTAKRGLAEAGTAITAGNTARFAGQPRRAGLRDRAASRMAANLLAGGHKAAAGPATPDEAVFAFGQWVDVLSRPVARERQGRAGIVDDRGAA